LDRAHLVVGELHRDERGVVAHRVEHLGRVEASGAVDAHHRDVGIRGARTRLEHRGVLDGAGHHVTAAAPRERAPHCSVHCLRAARREHDLARPSAEQLGNRLARVLDRDARRAAFCMQTSRIGLVRVEERQHRRDARLSER
jgi:hypothetical protein